MNHNHVILMTGNGIEAHRNCPACSGRRSPRVIAQEIRRMWPVVSPYARPYLDAMLTLDSIDQNYICDSGVSIVLYFLCNAQSWRGPDARRIKAELKALVKTAGK